MGCDISDDEFERHIEAVWTAWETGGVDTVDIAKGTGLSEAKVDWILACYLEGKYDQKCEAREELEKWHGFDPAAVVSQTSAERFKAMVTKGLSRNLAVEPKANHENYKLYYPNSIPEQGQ